MPGDVREKKEWIVGVFGRAAPLYDQVGPRFFARFGRRLVELAELPRGARVLDVAAGRGAVLFPAAERVGGQGKVIGIDLAEPMVLATSKEIRRRSLRHAEMRLMDAEHLEFPEASFDAVVCGFALFFFPHLEVALAEFDRVLRPGGVLAASTWGKSDDRFAGLREVAKAYGADVRLSSRDLETAEELRSVTGQADFVDVQIVHEETELVYADEEEWWATGWSHGRRAGWERLAPDVLERYKQDSFARLHPLKQPDGIHVLIRVLYTLARKPARGSVPRGSEVAAQKTKVRRDASAS